MRILVVMLLISLLYPASAQMNVEDMIYCPCGCGEILAKCHCETALNLKGEIKRKLLAGSKPEDLLSEYVKIYGASILVSSKPPKTKSNETLYLYLAGIGVTAVIAYVLGKSAKKKGDWEIKKR